MAPRMQGSQTFLTPRLTAADRVTGEPTELVPPDPSDSGHFQGPAPNFKLMLFLSFP